MFGSLCPTINTKHSSRKSSRKQKWMNNKSVAPDKCAAWPPPHWWQMLLGHSALDKSLSSKTWTQVITSYFWTEWNFTNISQIMCKHLNSTCRNIAQLLQFNILFDQNIKQNKQNPSSKRVTACGFGPQLQSRGCWTNVPPIVAPLAIKQLSWMASPWIKKQHQYPKKDTSRLKHFTLKIHSLNIHCW